MKKNNYKFGIVIPTYHEEKNIEKLAIKINEDLKNYNYLICFVDGSVNEKTKDIINTYFKEKFIFIKEKKNNNVSTRGYASFLGFKKLREYDLDYYVDIDADLATDTIDVAKGFEILKSRNIDLLIASRYLKKSIYTGSINRKLISLFYKILCTIFIGSEIKDYSCGFRFFSKKGIDTIIKQEPKFTSPIQHLENIIMIINKKLIIEEFPINFDQSNANSSIRMPHLFKYLIDFSNCLFKYIISKK